MEEVTLLLPITEAQTQTRILTTIAIKQLAADVTVQENANIVAESDMSTTITRNAVFAMEMAHA